MWNRIQIHIQPKEYITLSNKQYKRINIQQ